MNIECKHEAIIELLHDNRAISISKNNIQVYNMGSVFFINDGGFS